MTKKISGFLTLALSLLFLGGLTSCKTQQKSGSANAKGWTSLLAKDNVNEWHTFKKEKADPCWHVENGVLVLDHSLGGGGDLVTDKVYKNYILTLQWKISPEGNSGILINVQPQYKKTYYSGPEMQVLDNVAASDNKNKTHLAGSLYDMISCNPDFVHPAGEWNDVKIKQVDGHFTFWINDHKVTEQQIGSQEWKDMVAKSKFIHYKNFGIAAEGHIALQDHGHKVWYRNIKIKEL